MWFFHLTTIPGSLMRLLPAALEAKSLFPNLIRVKGFVFSYAKKI